jgi:heme-degrading monooxygenase HmoA
MGVEERRQFISLCLGTVGMRLSMKVDRSNKPAIARIWRGRVKRERADEYQTYNYEFGIKPLIEKAMGVQALRDDREFETEFMTISYWESIEAMSRFTGGDPTQIHHLQRDAEFLIEIPRRVQILTICESHGRIG